MSEFTLRWACRPTFRLLGLLSYLLDGTWMELLSNRDNIAKWTFKWVSRLSVAVILWLEVSKLIMILWKPPTTYGLLDSWIHRNHLCLLPKGFQPQCCLWGIYLEFYPYLSLLLLSLSNLPWVLTKITSSSANIVDSTRHCCLITLSASFGIWLLHSFGLYFTVFSCNLSGVCFFLVHC